MLFVDIGILGAAKDIVDADIVKISQPQERVGGRDSIAGLVFGKQRLFDTGLHLYRKLGVAFRFAQHAQVVFHNVTPMTLCHFLP